VPISVITVNWNGGRVLPDYLASINAQTVAPRECIVLDNGSTDDSLSQLEAAAVYTVTLPENRGFCEPNNLGARLAKGDALLLLNNDTAFGPDLIEVLENALIRHGECGLFACSMRKWNEPEVMENAGIGYRKTLSGFQLGRGDPASKWADEREVFGPSGGAALIRMSVIDDIGLFDDAFWAYNEDVDFALRARLAGYRCLYLPPAVVRHREGATAHRLGRRKMLLIQRNAEWAMRRNVPRGLQRRYAVAHAAYVLQQALKNGPAALAARQEAVKKPRPAFDKQRISDAEFTAWLAR
jgi:GT2 family glycosyltransferase